MFLILPAQNADFRIALIAYYINYYSHWRQKFHFLKLYAPLQRSIFRQPEFQSRIGYEASGVIAALGEGVENWNIGDRVGTLPLFHMSQHGV